MLPTSVSFGIALTEGTVRLTDARGTVAGSTIAGWLTIDTQAAADPLRWQLGIGVGGSGGSNRSGDRHTGDRTEQSS